MEVDSNLLFGALAVQLGLIEALQLAQGYRLCGPPPGRPLAEVLVEQGWLTAAERARVEAFAQPLDLTPSAVESCRAAHENAGETECSFTVESGLLSEGSNFTPPLPIVEVTRQRLTPPQTASAVGPWDHPEQPRYTWTRLYARGGIGQVWLAQDASLEREVALKALRPEATSDPSLQARFITEARITGQLAHPGVVPVYELGRRAEDGQLFYAMQLVRGRTLREAARTYHQQRAAGTASPLELRTLLNAFIAVCNTVAYAHARGVIHRDLKGLNVILGDYGEVFVLDWGLAKNLRTRGNGAPENDQEVSAAALARRGSPHETAPGQVLGTPAYMAPEQAAGQLDLVNERTDVYGLGAMLYEILTGQAPFIGQDTDEVLRKVRAEEPVRPRQIVPGAAPALEAICVKALAKTPDQRYPTAGELAADVQRWLADEPVLAYREPWLVRLGRWGRRHRSLVSAAAALLMTAVVALAVGLVLLGREQARTQAARLRAEDNFRLARQAVDHFYMRISKERLLNEQGMQPLRRELLSEARDFYRQFVAERGDDPNVQADLGNAYLQLGKITADIDSKAQALKSLDNATAVARRLTHLQPEAADYQHLLAECYNNQGVLYLALHRLEQAEQAFQHAIDVEQNLVARYPNTSAYSAYLALCDNNMGLACKAHDQLGPAEQALHQAIDLLTPLINKPDADDRAAADLAGSWTNLGILYSQNDETAKAEAAFSKARLTWERLVQRRPAVLEYRDSLASSYNNLGNLYQMIGSAGKARASLDQALAIRRRIVDENPAVTQYQQKLANVQINLGNWFRNQHQPLQAETAYHKALAIWSRLTHEHGDVPAFESGVGWAAYHLGALLKSDRQPGAALGWYTRAIQALEATPAGPRGEDRQILRGAYVGRAEIMAGLKRYADSLVDWDRAVQLSSGEDLKEAQTGRAQAATQLLKHTQTLLSQDNDEQACTAIESVAHRSNLSGAVLYTLARTSALVVASGRKGGRSTPPPADRATKLALNLLRRALAAGFFQSSARQQLLQTDPALHGLQSLPAFRTLVQRVESAPKAASAHAGVVSPNRYNRGH